MSDDGHDDERSRRSRGLLRSFDQLRRAHWIVLALSLALTVFAWQGSRQMSEERARSRFETEAARVVDLVHVRMAQYEEALWAGVAAHRSHGNAITRDVWREFATTLRLNERYPGINGIGLIERVPRAGLDAYERRRREGWPAFDVHPEHERDELLPIAYVEPVAINAKAIGLDVAHEDNRRRAALKARDTGRARISGPIVLVQDRAKTPGFLFYAPFYETRFPATREERQARFEGLVYAPFIVSRLMDGVLARERRKVLLRIADGEDILYDERSATARHGGRHHVIEADVYGRDWRFEIRDTPALAAASASSQPEIILFGGLAINAMLLALFLLMSRSERALTTLASMSVDLQEQAGHLRQANEALESFAYIASHDLKTPLRSIGVLATFIEDDLGDYLGSRDANPEVAHNIARLGQQIGRMNGLIDGVLDYSAVGTRTEALGEVDVDALVREIGRTLDVDERRLVVPEPLPTLFTHATRLEQVFTNLLSNAFKYHHDPASAVVTVSVVRAADFHRFSVADDGPGIDERFHERIFEVFQTLQTKDDVESTGIGLAIVKKSIEALGGSISVASVVGEGTTFSFEWPIEDVDRQRLQEAA